MASTCATPICKADSKAQQRRTLKIFATHKFIREDSLKLSNPALLLHINELEAFSIWTENESTHHCDSHPKANSSAIASSTVCVLRSSLTRSLSPRAPQTAFSPPPHVIQPDNLIRRSPRTAPADGQSLMRFVCPAPLIQLRAGGIGRRIGIATLLRRGGLIFVTYK